jgi:beta-lactamase regulating signal transducer with metallopeptidase domain
MNALESIYDLAPTLIAGCSIILAVGLGAMMLDPSLIQRKRFATTTLLVVLAWVGLAAYPMDRPLMGATPEYQPSSSEHPLSEDPPPISPGTSRPLSAADHSVELPASAASVTEVVSTSTDPGVTSAEISTTFVSILMLGSLLSGAYLLLAWMILRHRAARTRTAPPHVLEMARSLGIAVKRLRIVVSDRPTRPYCYGIRTPTIVIPASLCHAERRDRLRAVLLHELCHIDGKDLRDQALLALTLPLLYWHPLFWMLRRRLRLTAELLADERAAQRVDRRTYVRELIELVDHRDTHLPLTPVLPVLGLESEFYRRMNMVLNRKRPLTIRCSAAHTILRRCGAAIVLSAMTLSWGTDALPAQGVDETTLSVANADGTESQVHAAQSVATTYRYKFTGTYPTPRHLEQLLISVERSKFTMTGLRVDRGESSTAGKFSATLQCDVPRPGQVERLLLNVLQLRNDLHKLGITISHLGPLKDAPSGLEADHIDIARHISTLLSATRHRSTWTKTLDELITLFDNSLDPGSARHLAWLSSLQIRGPRDGQPSATVAAPGSVAGTDIRKVANLHDDLVRSPFFAQVASMSPPSGVKRIDSARQPATSFGFAWKIKFRPPQLNRRLPNPSVPTTDTERVTTRSLRARYRILKTLAGALPKAAELNKFTRSFQSFAIQTGVSIDRFVPVRGRPTRNRLQTVSYQYHFPASLWQAMKLLSFVENQPRLYRVRDFTLSPSNGSADHRYRLTIETFVYVPDSDLETRYGTDIAERRSLEPGYKFMGRKGRRDIFIDPREITTAK